MYIFFNFKSYLVVVEDNNIHIFFNYVEYLGVRIIYPMDFMFSFFLFNFYYFFKNVLLWLPATMMMICQKAWAT
jgi:hypothetical protein